MRIRPAVPLSPLFLAMTLLGFTPSPGGAQLESFGPLTTEEASPLQRTGFTHATEGADPVAPGTVRWDLWMGYSNIFEQDSSAAYEMFLDAERLYTTTTVRWGPVGAATARAATRGLGAMAQLTLSTPALQGYGDPELDGWPANLVVGLAGRFRDDWGFDVSIQEDIPANTRPWTSPSAWPSAGAGDRRARSYVVPTTSSTSPCSSR